MRLALARLCLDCEEVHEAECCPVCGSETFAFLTRWVTPAVEPSTKTATRNARSGEAGDHREQVKTYRELLGRGRRPSGRVPLVGWSAVGLAILGLTRFVWRAGRTPKGQSSAVVRAEVESDAGPTETEKTTS